jgi:hypothetical protein
MKNSSGGSVDSSFAPLTDTMLDLQLEAIADAVGAILAQQRREWQLEHAAFIAEHKAMLADLRRENAELQAALRAAADEQAAQVARAIEALPNIPGPEGPAGQPGQPGERGIGIAAITREAGRLLVELEDGRTFDLGDVIGERGDKGEAGPEGPPGRDGRDGLPGVPGANGERGLDGKDGRNGIDGQDGLGFDDFDIAHDGERGFIFRLVREGREARAWRFQTAAQVYRGVHKDGEQYERGDTVTWGGSLYHCNEPTTDKPGAGSAAWTLAVKRGQDGKDGKPGIKGDPGPEGRPGKDLTQMGPDGSKWG